jgi:hypothetical protein
LRRRAHYKANQETLIVPLQLRPEETRVHREGNDTVIVTQLPLQGIRELDDGEFAQTILVHSFSFPPRVGIGDPVVIDGGVDEILGGGRDPEKSAGIYTSGGGNEERVKKPDEKEVTENVGTKLEIELLSGEPVDWWGIYASVRDQHIQFGLLPPKQKRFR